jgi:hypothetical protein
MKKLLFSILLFISVASRASFILIPMDETQSNHLKAYGIAYWVLTKNVPIDWLLNYRGGSFAFPYSKDFEKECCERLDINWDEILENIRNDILENWYITCRNICCKVNFLEIFQNIKKQNKINFPISVENIIIEKIKEGFYRKDFDDKTIFDKKVYYISNTWIGKLKYLFDLLQHDNKIITYKYDNKYLIINISLNDELFINIYINPNKFIFYDNIIKFDKIEINKKQV